MGVDLWKLVSTGMGINRLLKKDYDISESGLTKLETFLGLPRNEILEYFYKQKSTLTLFGQENLGEKEKHAIEKSGILYLKRLNEIFNVVSESFKMKNSPGTLMYHCMVASNNKTAQ